MLDTVEVQFNPKESELKDIFEHPLACALWVQYKRNHIISQHGIVFLNEVCREIITDDMKFNESDVRDFLKGFMQDMDHIEHSMSKDETEWIEKTVPFMLGINTIELKVIAE